MRVSNTPSKQNNSKTSLFNVFFSFLASMFLLLSVTVIGVDAAFVDVSSDLGLWDGEPLFYDWTPISDDDFEGHTDPYGTNLTSGKSINSTDLYMENIYVTASGAARYDAFDLVAIINETETSDNTVLMFLNDSYVDYESYTYNLYNSFITNTNKTDLSVCVEFDIYFDNASGLNYLTLYYSAFGLTWTDQTPASNCTDISIFITQILKNGTLYTGGDYIYNMVDGSGWFHYALGYKWHDVTGSFPWTSAEKYMFISIPNGTTYAFYDEVTNITRPTEDFDATFAIGGELSDNGSYFQVLLDNVKFYDEEIGYWEVINSTKSVSKMMSVLIVPLLVMIPLIALFEILGKK